MTRREASFLFDSIVGTPCFSVRSSRFCAYFPDESPSDQSLSSLSKKSSIANSRIQTFSLKRSRGGQWQSINYRRAMLEIDHVGFAQ